MMVASKTARVALETARVTLGVCGERFLHNDGWYMQFGAFSARGGSSVKRVERAC
jgi:hypothetical protein